MTTGPQEVERKVRQLSNDVSSIYEILETIQTTQQVHSSRFDGIDQRFDGIDQRFDGIDQRFDGVDQRFDGVDKRLETLDTKMDTVLAILRPDAG